LKKSRVKKWKKINERLKIASRTSISKTYLFFEREANALPLGDSFEERLWFLCADAGEIRLKISIHEHESAREYKKTFVNTSDGS